MNQFYRNINTMLANKIMKILFQVNLGQKTKEFGV